MRLDKSGENKNVWRRAPIKFTQMSGEEVKMSGKAKKNIRCTHDDRTETSLTVDV